MQDVLETDSPNQGRSKLNENFAEVPALIDAVGRDTTTSGDVAFDLDEGRAFRVRLNGDLNSLAFQNMPHGGLNWTEWYVVFATDGTGGYSLNEAGMPDVTWLLNGGWDQLDLQSPNAFNLVAFLRQGTATYAIIIDTGVIRLDSYKFSFLEDDTIRIVIDQDEEIDVANAVSNGDGSISYAKNGSGISTRTAFASGDTLSVTVSGQSQTTSVSIPRYLG